MKSFAKICLGGILLASTALGEQAYFQSKTVIVPKNPALLKGGIGEDSADVS